MMKFKGMIVGSAAVLTVLASGIAADTAHSAPLSTVWKPDGGCAPSWQIWDRDRLCGTIINNSSYGVRLVKNWHTGATGEPIWRTNFDTANLTGLSPGQTFGEPQGYDVDGVCAPDTRDVWLARGGTEWFLPAAKCRKINGGTIGIVIN